MNLQYHAAVYALAGIDSYEFDKLIQVEVDGAAGLLNRDAAAELAASRLGIKFSQSRAKHGDTVWIYTIVASRKCAALRRDQE